MLLTLSTWQTKTFTFANSVDPDETARNEPSHQDLHCLPFGFGFLITPHPQQWICPKSKIEEYFRNSRGRGRGGGAGGGGRGSA